jgi:hypothetical protein
LSCWPSHRFVVPIFAVASPRAQTVASARNVILITIDGLRWQEFLVAPIASTSSAIATAAAVSPNAASGATVLVIAGRLLMPFMWTTHREAGTDLRRPAVNSSSRVTNGLWFSYPGYSEMFVGAADAAIDSNNKVPNPNVTVLEWLNGRPDLPDGSRPSDRGTCCRRF